MKIDESILLDYLKGRLNKAQQIEIEDWYAQSEQNRKKMEDICFLDFVADRINAVKDIDVEKSLLDLKKRMASGKSINHKKHRLQLLHSVYRYAAILIIGVMTTYFITKYVLPDHKMLCEVSTNSTSVSNVKLPDGSVVRLQPRSKLSYPNSFSNRSRVVSLEGEAFFNVAKRNGMKFKVNALGTQIVVKGTKFNLKTDAKADFVEAVLYSGAIDFLASGHRIGLKPNQKVVYDRRTNDLHVYNVASENCGKVFNNENLEDVVEFINNIYGSQILLKNEAVGKIKFTGTIDPRNSLQHTIEVLNISIGTHSEQNGKSMVIVK